MTGFEQGAGSAPAPANGGARADRSAFGARRATAADDVWVRWRACAAGFVIATLALAGCADDGALPTEPELLAPNFHLVECGSIEDGEHEDEEHEHECAEELLDASYARTKNMKFMAYSPRIADGPSVREANTDLAFWGRTAYQGTFEGFRILDISDPENIVEVLNYTGCAHPSGQGDIVVWGSILVRSWDANTTTPNFACGGQPVALGFEGLHIFDVSNPLDPALLASVDLPCGSHTVTLAPDLQNNRLVLYSSSAAGSCRGLDVVWVPLDNPAAPEWRGLYPTESPLHFCHDAAVIQGDVNRLACAGQRGFAMWSLAGDGASIGDPKLLYTTIVPGVTIGHSVSFTWDGAVLVFGHEPGGGGQARCREGVPVTDRTLFFFAVETGSPVGEFVLPRLQTIQENCTWHNFNVVPVDDRYVLVSGNYQSGISVVDFTDPANAKEIAFADPAPASETGLLIAGDWAAYWYNGLIYESDLRRGLVVWRLTDPAVAGARKLDRLNPQTQETSSPLRGKKPR